MNKLYSGSNVEECLKNASLELNIPQEDLKYSIIEEKKGIFRKTVSISIEVPEPKGEDAIDGKIKVVEGRIIVTDPSNGGIPASLIPSREIGILVDGRQAKVKTEVYEKSNIEVILDETAAKRLLDIKLSDDRLKAYADVTLIPGRKYKLKESNEVSEIQLDCEISEEAWPPFFTQDEVKKELQKSGVTFGLVDENIKKCENCRELKNIIVAIGEEAIDGEDDTIELKFAIDSELKKLREDSTGKIDFKNIGSIDAVEKGSVLAIKNEGKDGRDGKDVRGKKIEHRKRKKVSIKAVQGCTLVNNTVVASISGKPCMKDNSFYVFEIHEIQKDVDLQTGNIKFKGDVIIKGSIKEGMKVESGNAVHVFQNVEWAQVAALGDITIDGSIIASKIIGGGENVAKINEINDLSEFKKALDSLILNVEEIKEHNLLGGNRSDGEIVKVLIETKFKLIPKICLKVISDFAREGNLVEEEQKLLELIKSKIIGLAPLSIKHYSELNLITEIIDKKIKKLSSTLLVPVNVKIKYAQDSEINSTGDIIIAGKGIYVSDITAHNNIYFLSEGSVVRGGSLKAENQIKCKTVGSTGRVITKLIVGDKGEIWTDIAYENTIFSVGGKEYALDTPSKNVHAYLNNNNELIVDRFKL